MKDLKISDKLLSWVLGCECEFVRIIEINNKIFFNCKDKPKIYENHNVYSKPKTKELYINLHTFIHLAKTKACDKGYEFSCNSKEVGIYNFEGLREFKTFADYSKPHSIENILEALEWVAEKLDKK